jgi:diadenosine tetraphosphatase ApaH/serine/threonine PP2A family protein phosphatase
MKYAILGDVHANLSALQAVLERVRTSGAQTLLSVGDVVGYGAAPRETLELLREHSAVVVQGNHDAACGDRLNIHLFNPSARAAIQWTRAQLSRSDLKWLAQLPLVVELSHCSVAHATLARPERFDYVQSTADAEPSLDALRLPVCFVGHTHVPVTLLRPREDPTRTAYSLDAEVDLDDAVRALVNVGSVGQPRDEDPRAAVGFYDSERGSVWIERVEYDIEREAARIRAAGLPATLANRLFLGV